MATLEQIAYDHALRALDKQERSLEELRARTGVLVATSSIAMSLLGSRIADTRVEPMLLAVAAIAALVTIVSCLFVLLARPLTFCVDGVRAYESFVAVRHDTAEIHRRLAYEMHRMRRANQPVIRSMRSALAVAASGLLVELTALIAMMVGGTL